MLTIYNRYNKYNIIILIIYIILILLYMIRLIEYISDHPQKYNSSDHRFYFEGGFSFYFLLQILTLTL